jgi:hypothetical protein
VALYDAETWTLRAVDEKHVESFEMWCWRRMEQISWTDHVRNEEVLLRVKWIFERLDGGHDWINLAQDRVHVAGSCECGDEPLGSIKCGKFLD